MLTIYAHKLHKNAIIPTIAYNNTSAAFDITSIYDYEIKPNEKKIIKNGLSLIIDEKEPYYMTIHLRSSLGFKKGAIPHIGIVDAGYTGALEVLIHNLGNEVISIKKGERYAQILVHKKPEFQIKEIDENEYQEITKKQTRGNKGFGSSNNQG